MSDSDFLASYWSLVGAVWDAWFAGSLSLRSRDLALEELRARLDRLRR